VISKPFYLKYLKDLVKKGAAPRFLGKEGVFILNLLNKNSLNFFIVTSMLKFGRQVGLRNS
jgi:hypothetical protein